MNTLNPSSSEHQKSIIISMLDSYLADAGYSVRQKCLNYITNPNVEFSPDVQHALGLVDAVRDEYLDQLDKLRDKYEVRLKMSLAMLVNELQRS